MFNGSRLALARKRRGWTKRKLAEQIGVTDRSIMLFEKGELEPGELTLPGIAEALQFPMEFFSGPDLEEVPTDAVSFRALSKMTASQQKAAESAVPFAFGLSDWVGDRFHLPEPNVPRLGPGIDPETAAEVVRAEWSLAEAPISNVIHLLESRGVRVFSLAEENREVDAFSLWRPGQPQTPYVFLNTQKSAEHSRLDAAHELGHLVMHWHHDPPRGRQAEYEAQRFGSALLMPPAAITASAPRFASLAEIKIKKRRWRVSAMAYVYRLHQLGLLTDWHYRTLNVEMSKRGYRTKEPNPIHRETSQVLNKVFNALRKERVGKEDIADALMIYPKDLDALVFNLAMLPEVVVGGGQRSGTDAPPDLRLVKG
jgi:Zn-dependent peptidase ImmA (M78 family)/transcriptional regulator with XRE-family HTH domain